MLRLQCLGGLELIGDGRALGSSAGQPRRLALLAVLAAAGDRATSRERLISLLWPDADEERGRRSLAQALYAIRRDLGDENVVSGTNDLRLDAQQVGSDLADFRAAIAEGALERAAELYHGPFLDGVSLAGLSDFGRWADEQRGELARQFATIVERLAARATANGDRHAAVRWWRRLAGLDPVDGRVAMALMEAQVAANDSAGALRQALIFEACYREELEAEPSGEVAEFLQRLRAGKVAPPLASAAPPVPATVPAVSVPAAPAAAAAEPSSSVAARAEEPVDALAPVQALGPPHRRRRSRRVVAGVALGLGVAGALGWLSRSLLHEPVTDASSPVLAVGHLADFGGPSTLSASAADLLATNLARSRGVRVVSSTRVRELLQSPNDTSPASIMTAARAAGATELIEGTLFSLGGGRLRLDLRRVDIANGGLRAARSVEGTDLFALVDSGTAQLVRDMGGVAPTGSIADVTTRSVNAYALYVGGLQRYHADDIPAAERLFDAALREDPGFAMAAYYHARSSRGDWRAFNERMTRAVQLAERATDFERLLIRGAHAAAVASPALRAIADTMVLRYPDEVQGYFMLAGAMLQAGDRDGELHALRRVLALDSVGIVRGRTGCLGCDAIAQVVNHYLEVDSASVAIAEARRWVALQPRAVRPLHVLADAYAIAGRHDDAIRTLARADSIDSTAASTQPIRAVALGRRGEFDAADRIWQALARKDDARYGGESLWYRAINLRAQGRLSQALELARRFRALHASRGSEAPASLPATAVLEAVVRLERGETRVAAAMFDSIARWRIAAQTESDVSRATAWYGTHAASALAAGGDTAELEVRAARIQQAGARTATQRDRRISHHTRGLLLVARRQDAAAVAAFDSAVWSRTFGYTRSNLEIARALLRLGRAREAIAWLQPALRGSVEASNLYVSRTELHEALAQAWDAVGARDSARPHHAFVARAWANADPQFAGRRAAAVRGAAPGARAAATR